MKNKLKDIIPPKLTLWKEGNELKYKAGDRHFSKTDLDFIRENEAFFNQFITEKSQKCILVLPLAHNQKALWFLHQVDPQNISYNISVAGKIRESFNMELFRIALNLLSDRHIMLRSVFASVKGKETSVCQIILDQVRSYIEEIDATKINANQLDELINEKYCIPFNLKSGPLFKTYFFHNESFVYFLFNVHHIICDAWSLKVFLKELFDTYNALVDGRTPGLEPIDVDYGDYIFDQEEFLHGEKGTKQLNYWNNILKGRNNPLNLPTDFSRPEIQTFNGATYHFTISNKLFTELNRVAIKLNVTPNVILFTLYELLLSELSLQKQFFIGIPVTARTRKEFMQVFGYVINMLSIECSLEEGKKISEVVHQNKTKLYSALENQEVPFPVVVESVSPKRDPSRPIVFQAMYNFMNKRTIGNLLDLWKPSTDKFKKFGALEISSYPIDSQEGQFDLTLEILHNIDEFTCVFKYNTDLFKLESIKRFEAEYIELLNNLISNPDYLPSWLNLKETNQKDTEVNIKATGTFTIEPVSLYLKFWMDKLRFNVNIDFVGYNQVFQQLLNPNSEFNLNHNGFNIALIRSEDLIKPQIQENNVVKIAERFEELVRALSFATEINPGGKYIIVFCPESDSVKKNPEINLFINSWEEKILKHFNSTKNLYFITSKETIEKYSVDNYYEPLGEEHGHIPYKEDFFISIATLISRKINSFYRLPIKAIAVDCDNTLWKGIVGEDGYMGIKIGRAELAIQRFLIEQYSEGVILCLCSKNNENDVFEVFDKNEEMILKREHISFYRINWLPKSQNLISLSEEINIGIDSFVLIDDSSSECDEVRFNTPQVITIQKPENDFNADFLRNSWIFDKLKVTDEDKVRSKRYKEESVRAKYRSSVDSYKDFIEGLQIKTDIDAFQENDISRISQLTFRTNQFNFTTIRRDEFEIKQLSLNPDFDCFQINVSDRFGEYGLTGVIIASKQKGYVIDTFLLSCRILGKGVEHKLIRFLGARVSDNKSDILEIPLRKTAKNIPAQMFLDQNFKDYKYVNDESIIYLIPVSVAISFSFSPAMVKEEQDKKVTIQREEPKSDINTELRNSFYYLVINNYLELCNIKKELKKLTSVQPDRPMMAGGDDSGQIVRIISSIWKEILNRDDIKLTDNFFEIGGHSVLIPQIVISLEKNYDIKIKIVDIFQYPTIKDLSGFIQSKNHGEKSKGIESKRDKNIKSTDIAIIGMAGRFPGAENIDEFWKTIASGSEETIFYSREYLENKGVDNLLLEHKNYIYANPLLESADKFDSSFFGFTPREADFMDPQHRIFLEVCYEAIENAGYRKENSNFPIGVFGGCGMNNYLVKNLLHHPETKSSLGEMLTVINNNSDYMTTRVSYKLNLKGPSIDIQTACSTSLVAVHIACQSLINNECYIALGGGSFINIPHDEGYLFEPGGINSPDGHCRPFDKDANGTIFGEGAGVVVLKRLEDAIDDHDTIWAVIKGTAINNDGSQKVGYMAPSVQGQSDVITAALEKASINPETITYVEAHGTGTKMGDPIEISALSMAYGKYTQKKNYCALGSVKGNIGHLDAAAGIAGLIKTTLLLKNKKLPPLTNFKENNPELYLEDSSFYINTKLRDWETGDYAPRRAGVSSFGIGGTNAHCILEEAPEIEKNSSKQRFHLLPVSAKTKTGLLKQQENLLKYLKESNETIADIAFTLQQGRESFNKRMLIYCDGKEDGIRAIENSSYRKIFGEAKLSDPKTVFMFTGQGSQYVGMARDLYNDFALFRKLIDEAREVLSEYDIDVLKFILGESHEGLEKELNQTFIAQPLLFAIQYSTARLLEEFGISPDALIGHSIGELTAACIAGVFSYKEGLKIVAERGRIMQQQKPGSMLSVKLPADLLKPHLIGKTEISLINAPEFCVVSGDFDDIDKLAEKLRSDFPDVYASKLKTSHAFHSYLIEPAVDKFTDRISSIKFKEPQIPVISNITGTWAIKEKLQDPDYWGNHIRATVNFAGGINELLKDENTFLLEVGPGNSISTLLSEYPKSKKIQVSSTIRHPKEKMNDTDFFLVSIGKAWTSGISIKWSRYYHDELRCRIPLPTYPFERTKHWIYPKESFNFIDTKDIADLLPESVEDFAGKIEVEEKGHYHDRPLLDNEFKAAESELEKRIVIIWEELLGIKGIGVTDDFFQLGGHSLLAAQVLNRMNEEFDSGIIINSFFNYPTISGLIENETFEEKIIEAKPETEKLDYSSSLPLSPSQERLWIINQIDNNNPAYNISFSYILKGKLERGVFQKAIDLLFDRHKVLKSYIRDKEGSPVAYINSGTDILISEQDFSGSLNGDLDNRVQEFLEDQSRASFDIQNGPLYRIFLIKLGKENTLFHCTIHHLIFDGWSWGILTKELKEIYDALLLGRISKLDQLSFDYFEYSQTLEKEDQHEKYKASREYWAQKLTGITGHLNFPLDFNRKEISTGKGSRVPLDLGREMSEKLRKVTKQQNVTLYMFLLSAFGVLLNRYSGDKDICIGSPTANRPDSRLEKLIGLFINSIVLRLQFNEESGFSDLLKEVKKIAIEALSHQDLPFENLVDILNPERVVNMNPIFQVMFALQNAPRPPLDLEGIHSERLFHKNGVSPLDISFYAWEDDGSILGEIEFSTDILKRSTIENLKENFISLLNNIISNPDTSLKNLSIISDFEKQHLVAFNSTEAPFPALTVQELFEQRVKVFSDKTAIESISGSLSYSELEKRSNQFAHYLIKKGFGQDKIAALSLNRSSSMIIAVLGILKAGGCYLPMDPTFPDERLFYMIEDSGAELLVTEGIFLERFKNINICKIAYDSDQREIQSQSHQNLDLNINVNSLAYIIYTSGSTGKPKGVKVHHLAVTNFINSMSKAPGLTSEDKLLAVTTLSFDISVLEIFLPLSQGASIFIAENEHISDGEMLSHIIEDFNISILQATPATWALLIASGWMGNKKLKALCGGEALQPNLAKDLLPRVGSLWNMYGPTETTVWSTCQLITDFDKILVGRPIDNTQVHILHNNQEQPVGIVGEVCIGGLGVSKGYHNRDELTREKFCKWNDKTIYRTGDIGRFLENGAIELFGRNDNQIKLHGYRIEPGEIEFQLSQIEGVIEAVVKLERFNELDDRLIGFLCVKDSFRLDHEQIIMALGNKIPSYMVPSLFVTMKEFPRTLNGKIDKKALKYDVSNLTEAVIGEKHNLTEAEKSLVLIWQDILKIKNIKKNLSFFDIGGNSLLAIRLMNKIKEEFGFTLTFSTLISNPSINQLALLIESQHIKSGTSIKLVHLTERENLPLTVNQKRIWLISKLNPDLPSYIIPFTYKLSGLLNREIFQKSIEILFLRHHTIFSVIKEVNGEPFCNIVTSKVNVSFFDFRDLPEGERGKKVEDIINADSIKVFDFESGPLYRLTLTMTGNEEYYFHISVHHIIFDGWSWPVFVNDLSKIYNSLLNGKEIELETLEFQQYDYANWEKKSADSKNNNELMEFWRENLKDASTILNFPYDFQRKKQPSGKANCEIIQLSKCMSDKLRQISKSEGSSLFTTLLSVYGIQMYKYTGEIDINIGLPVAYRPHSTLENIFGMFVNTIVVRLKFEKDYTFKKILHLTNEVTLNAIAHQDLPFENIVEIVNPDRTSNANPLFQVCFVWQNNLNIPIILNGVKSKRISERERTTPFDITLYMWENEETIEGEIEYSTDLLKRDTIIQLKNNFLNLINGLIESPDIPVKSLSMISVEEKKMIDNFNATLTNYPKDKTIVQLFEEQVVLYPNKPALVFKEDFLTYKQLNERTNQLARTLRKAGVKENTPVGILVEKSLDMIVGILGILKAGGGYVPIDPEYPEQRINFIINDSECKVLLTQDKFMKIPFENVSKLNLNSKKSYRKEKSNIENLNNSSSLAYIMYTSGTTGKPKGSIIIQYNVVRLVRNTNYIKFTSDDRILLTGAIVFDATTFEIWGALLNGGTLYIVEKETILSPQALGDQLVTNDITVLWLTSALFTQISEIRTDIFCKLKYLVVGGDVLSAHHINKVRNDNPKLKVINGYGPTENTTFSTTFLIERDFDHNIPIGKPISNSTAYIFNNDMNYQPIGLIGELYVGGDGLSKGYLKRADLNGKSFIYHPDKPGERLYKTGDYAKWLTDGNIEFHGRIDNQLKIRGFRVELEEIETAISEIDGVIETIVKSVNIHEGDVRLVAFLNISDTFSTDINEISRKIKEKLPSYMVPSVFKLLHGFPKTINGKTDKDALNIDLADLEAKESQDLKTFSPTERIIYNIWSETLKTLDISSADNFFEVGGNSLLAISVLSRIESAFNINLGLRIFFDSPRIKELAEVVDLTIQKSISNTSLDKKNETNSKIIKGEI